MKSVRSLALAAASLLVTLHAARAGEFADAVAGYQPGVGVSPRFTHAGAALGAPSEVNPFGETTDPFNPPYGTNQIVSIGAGGSLTLQFHKPIQNHPHHVHGLDFIIHGNAGFVITNEFDLETFNWIGTPATDGSMFGVNNGETRVSVSADGIRFYTLNPALAPTADGPFPTDAAGNTLLPTVPGLAPADFAGATLDDIRRLYAGSAGGTAYDITWAVDEQGRSVHLPVVRYVRIEVLSGKSEVDALSVVGRKAGRFGTKLR